MDDLARWLHAQLDIDTARATAAADGDSGEWFMGDKWNVYRAEDETPDEDRETNTLVVYGNVKDQSEHIAAHDPARVLREIDAKRQVLTEYVKAVEAMEELTALRERLNAGGQDLFMTEMGLGSAIHKRDALRAVLRLLALPYSDRPGYEEALASLA